jgi:hypothetical protein
MGGIMMPYMGAMAGQQIISNPNAIPNLEIWYNADIASATNFGTNIPTTGTGVKTWTDRSGVGHDANQSVSNKQPLWVSGVKNGYGIIRFDGSNDVLSINPLIGWARGIANYTLFIVGKASALTGTPNMICSDANGFRFFWDGTHWAIGSAGGTAASTTVGDTTSFHVFSQIFDGSQTGVDTTATNNARLKFRYDQVDQTLTFSANVGTTSSNTASYIYFGADSTGGSNHFNGDIAEFIMFTRTLSSTEIIAVENYLKSHWAI